MTNRTQRKVIQGTQLPAELVKAFRIACIEKNVKTRHGVAVMAEMFIDGKFDDVDFVVEMEKICGKYGGE